MTTPDKPRTTDAADTSTTPSTPTPYTSRITPNGYDRYVTAPDGKPAGYVADAALRLGWEAHDTPRRYTASAPSGLILGYYPTLTDATLRVAEHDRFARSIPDDWWVDGHCISAQTADDARAACVTLYGHQPATVRPWTSDDDVNASQDDTSTDLPCDGTGWVCRACHDRAEAGRLLDFHDGPETEWRPLPFVEHSEERCQVCETVAYGYRHQYGYWELPNTMITADNDMPAARDLTTPNDRELLASYRLAQQDVREAQAEVDALRAELHRRNISAT